MLWSHNKKWYITTRIVEAFQFAKESNSLTIFATSKPTCNEHTISRYFQLATRRHKSLISNMHQLSTSALSIASAHALSSNILKRQSPSNDNANDHADDVCIPKNSTGSPDFDAPCNVFIAIQTQCVYGPQAADYVALPEDDEAWSDTSEWTEQTPEAQRDCLCQSQFLNQAAGCQKCYESQGSSFFEYASAFAGLEHGFAEFIEEDYCAVDNTPEDTWAKYVYSAALTASPPKSAATSSSASMSSTVPATETNVSLYFTASVPGSSAYLVSQPTPTGSSGNVTYTSLNTEGGMIKPTNVASVGDKDGEESGSSDNSESSGSAAAGNAEQTGSSSSDESAAVRMSLANTAIVAGAVGIAATIFGL